MHALGFQDNEISEIAKIPLLTDKPVQVSVARSLNIQVSSADVINGLIVDHEWAVRMFQRCVSGQDRIVWLDDGCGDLETNPRLSLYLLL